MNETTQAINKTLTLIIPVFDEEACIEPFVKEVSTVAKNASDFPKYNILFVDDGSTDNTLIEIKKQNDKIVKYISFSRNFGKEAAIYAGLKTARKKLNTELYAIMDVDLQDPPKLLPKMLTILNTNNDIERVGTRRSTRKGEPPVRSFFAKCFYKLMNTFSQVELVDGARDYQMMTSKYIDAILSCGEYNRFLKGLSQWVGFKTHWIEYENIERKNGNTRWSFWGLLGYSIQGIVAYSTWPLRVISIIGLILSVISLLFLIVVFVRAIIVGDPVAGWPSLTCILLILGGLLLTSLGVLGLYFEKMYLEIKQRPVYIINERNL